MTLLKSTLLAAVCCIASLSAQASADFPSQPVKLVVGFSPGGTTDILARLLAVEMSKHLGQSVIVENKAGASGTLAAAQVAKAQPNGYTLMLTTSSVHGVAPTLFRQLSYETNKDFAPVSLVSKSTMVLLANNDFAANSVIELIKLAKQQPGKINYASSGPGSTFHLATALFEKKAGVQMTHVPYKGGGTSMTALIGGEIQIAFDNIASTRNLVDTGKIKALAVTSTQRSPSLPKVPTLAESGLPGFSLTSWSGLVAPAKTPAEVIARLNNAVNQSLQSPLLRKRMTEGGTDPQGGTPAEFDAFIKSEQVLWGEAVRLTGATAE